jgi:hypothetical protein
VITVAETSEFARRAKKLLSEEEKSKLIFFLAARPKTGAIMEGAGGIRKIRWAKEGKGKSGGVRIIYFFHNEEMPLYLLTLYGKNEKDNLSEGERKALAKLARLLVQTAMPDSNER